MKLVVENSHQVIKLAAAAGLIKALIAEKHGNSRHVSLEKILKLGPRIKNIKAEKTTLNGCASLSKTADKGVNRFQESAIDARICGAIPNEEKSPCSTSTTTPATAAEVVLMSPKKALRVAMLKSRFAYTIFKATHLTLYEKTRIEDQLKDVKMASRKIEIDAARMALDKIEKTVFIYSSPNMLREMDILFGCYSNPKCLDKIGFYLKQNYVEKDEAYETEDDREEREIF
ncbi:transcription factor GTE10-like [Salvia divinorum]|uniref:Transcription factor GTE10-like n=1 Tax=Salvia divinorum TaxID=28513 RepID=A0ABD1HMJ4_SALDI